MTETGEFTWRMLPDNTLDVVEISNPNAAQTFLLYRPKDDPGRDRQAPYRFLWAQGYVFFQVGNHKFTPGLGWAVAVGPAETEDHARKIAEAWLTCWLDHPTQRGDVWRITDSYREQAQPPG